LPISVQIKLAKSKHLTTKSKLASDPRIAVEAQKILAENGDFGIKKYLALNPNVDESVQDILVKDLNTIQHLINNPHSKYKIQITKIA
jgi:hypothetical protein